ncbi:hypothetical protein ASPCADRAFT_128115 [Aspergillus carbonarius ITEM 5010]|uniref:ribonuclease H n=1 Tax=Aspergillus carbonarius (strain ITEM 5010) TaxID=602072 RepID=A0A1R3RTY1_ASPC5|nr:hypothetical protein ASPCADRAFT_128115 [Aspergillus carbonarius ITEM 5010]
MTDHSLNPPITLSNGQLLCGAHGFVTCAKCCVDYTFMQQLDAGYSCLMPGLRDTSPSSDSQSCVMSDVSGICSSGADTSVTPMMIDTGSEPCSESPPIVPTGILIALDEDPKPKMTALPKRFIPPKSASPRDLFKPRYIFHGGHPGLQRFVGVEDSHQFLVYAGGACLKNGNDIPKAGWSFIFKPRTPGCQTSGRISAHLETTGPTGEARKPTSQRAELRAVIAALRYMYMHGSLFNSVVVATDSHYVVTGATRGLRKWLSNGWTNCSGEPIRNRDLWQDLLDVVHSWAKKNREVYLWMIPRKWNREADGFARLAVTSRPVPVDFGELIGHWQ